MKKKNKPSIFRRYLDYRKRTTKKRKKRMVVSLIVLNIFVLGFLAGTWGVLYFQQYQERIDDQHQRFSSNLKKICSTDLELEELSNCLRDFISLTYDYHVTNEAIAMYRDFTEVYENGGDCLDYALLYSKIIDRVYPWYESDVVLDFSDNHAYAVVYDDYEGVECILDQTATPDCTYEEGQQ